MKANGLWQRISTIILAILMIVPFSFIKTKAQTLNTNYSLTQYNYYNSLSSGDNPASFICVNFKKPATGTLTITATGIGSVSGSNNVYLVNVISGGNLTKINTNNFTVSLTGSDNVQVLVEGNPTVTTATFLTYTMSFSGSYIDNETVSLDNIDANVVTISGQVSDAVTVLGQINTKLASLSIQDYTTILNTINSSIGSVETAIGNIPDYTSVLNSINSYLNSVNINVADIETICSGIQSTVNNILSTLQNIDNLIDTITWSPYTSASMPYSLDLSTWSTDNNNNLGQSVYIDITSIIQSYHIYFISLPNRLNNPGLYGQEPYVQFFIQNSSSNYVEQPCEYYFVNQGAIPYLIINIHGFASSNTNFKSVLKFTVQSPYSFYYRNQGGWKAISYNDIEYWKISSVLQEHMLLSNNASKEAIDQQQSTNQSFESQSDQFHNLESTFQSNFDTAFNAINPSDTTSAITQFAPAITWFTAQLGSLYNASGNMKVLFTLPLLLGLAMFFLGRGGKVFDHPERREDHNARDS